MKYRSAKGFTGWGQIGILFAFTGAGLIIAGIIQVWIGFSIIDPNIPMVQKGDAMLKALFKPENVNWLQLSQVISTFFLMFLPSIIYSFICNGKDLLWLGFSPRINLWQVLLAFFIIYCANFIAQPAQIFSKEVIAHFPHFNRWARGLEDTYNQQVTAMSNLKTWKSLLTAIVIIAFFPALFEEMLFRGAMQNLFIRWWKRPLLAIIVTAVIFSFIHGEAYPFLSRVILGFVLGMLYWLSKNIWINVIAHFLNNAFYLVQVFIGASDDYPWWTGLLAIPIFYLLFVLFKRASVKNKSGIEMDETKIWIKSTAQYSLTNTKDPFNEWH